MKLSLGSEIYVAGHNGMVGSAICRLLEKRGYENLILRTHSELDLTKQDDVNTFFKKEKPDVVFLAAAKVGGINANMNNQSAFLMDNIGIEYNVINAAFNNDVDNLMFLGSSCIYPRESKQPIKEDYLLTGPLEPTNEGYALSKIVGLKACQYYNEQYGTNYIGVMPTNLYGINDNFDLESSHLVPAIIRKMHEAKINNNPQVEIWGTGKPYRELLYVDDMADATLFAFENYKGKSFINVGTGEDLTIRQISETIKNIVGYEGELYFNTDKPDGMYRKLLDVTNLKNLGWEPKYSLEEGLKITYEWYLNNK
ncbi:GDP-L-fucose synthase family protein [Methanobrevibacter sp.]|uniref:GDP-L-fucose synthase family protein n=1 Tax=Methanobrevibacter sp. TaxID=66852 RepID=UPI002E785D9D|nr:GDP-L-fucose synthase [Methanobrevibacter sp.]MEE0024279.1 GDP-L-fucose synthase [Methanobrevibacter sp.]